MKRKPEIRAAILHAPAGYKSAAFPELNLPHPLLTGLFDWVQIFVENKAQLDKLAPKAAKALKPNSILWISFPKGQLQDPDRPHPRPGLGYPPLA